MSASGKVWNRWTIDFREDRKSSHRGKDLAKDDLPAPPGYISHLPNIDDSEESQDTTLLAKQGWNVALGPWKQLPMNLFVMWMAGNSVSIFPIMMVGMMFLRTAQALMNFKEVSSKLLGEQAIFMKAVYILGNLVAVAFALYKFNNMGLLPTHQSDWLEFMEPQKAMEVSGGGVALL